MSVKKNKRIARKRVSRGHKTSDVFYDSMSATRRGYGRGEAKK